MFVTWLDIEPSTIQALVSTYQSNSPQLSHPFELNADVQPVLRLYITKINASYWSIRTNESKIPCPLWIPPSFSLAGLLRIKYPA